MLSNMWFTAFCASPGAKPGPSMIWFRMESKDHDSGSSNASGFIGKWSFGSTP